jgi:hypothetical protein
MTTGLVVQPDEINTLSNILGTPSVPKRYESVQDMVAAVLVGRELGMQPMTAINELFIVNGSVAMSGKAMLSLVKQRGHDIRVSISPEKATAVAWRRIDGKLVEVGTYEFTKEDAEAANLWAKDTYQLYPADMLGWKAVARCVRFAFPDVLLGYIPDELMEDAPFEALEADATFGEGEGMSNEELTEALDAEVVEE